MRKTELIRYSNENFELNASQKSNEHYLVLKYLKSTDIVLEICTKYNIVSNTIGLILNDKNNHITNELNNDIFINKFLNFNVLFIDYNSCLYDFLEKNLFLLCQLELIILKKDDKNIYNYDKIYKILHLYDFMYYDKLLNNSQQVWIKKIL